jgi:ankyrin repeat protein
MIAASWSNDVLVKLLVSLSANILAVDSMGNTCFHYAVCFSSAAVFETLCSKVLRPAKDSGLGQEQILFKNRNEVTKSAVKSLTSTVHAVISLKRASFSAADNEDRVDFNSFARSLCSLNSSGHSCLHIAVARRDIQYLCTLLGVVSDMGLQSRLLCAADHRGETPLLHACRGASLQDILVLIYHGARVGAESDNGTNSESMLRQIISGKSRVTQEVVQLGIILGQILQKEDREYEALMELKQSKDPTLSPVVTAVEFCQLLHRKRRLGIGMPSLFDITCLAPSIMSHSPTLASSCDWIMKLVEAGDSDKLIEEVDRIGETIASCADMTDARGNTLLHKAVEHQHLDITLVLIDAGVDASKLNLTGVSAVHIAASSGAPKFFFPLISSLLSFDFLFKTQQNIMHLAAAGGSLDILYSLLSFGGTVQNDVGNSNGALEAATQHQQFKTSIFAATILPFPSCLRATTIEIKDFMLQLEHGHSDWCSLIEESTADVHSEVHASITDANGLMVAQSLSSNDASALWRHVSDSLWRSLSNWQSRDEHRHYLVTIYEDRNTLFIYLHSFVLCHYAPDSRISPFNRRSTLLSSAAAIKPSNPCC